MSLIAAAIRITTVKVLTGATLAGDRVFDSVVDPIDQRVTAEAAPVIIVYVDDDKATIEGKDWRNASRDLDLVIEIAVAQKTTISVEGEDHSFEAIEIPHTDAGLELTINLIGRQIMRALMAGEGPWNDLWRMACITQSQIASRRAAGSDKSVKFAARQMVITTETLSEPAFGKPAEAPFWVNFLAALAGDADPALNNLEKIFRAEIETPSLPAWRQAIADLGANISTATAIGIGPIIPGQDDPDATPPYPQPDEAQPPVDQATVAIDDADDWTLNDDTAEDALGPEPDEP